MTNAPRPRARATEARRLFEQALKYEAFARKETDPDRADIARIGCRLYLDLARDTVLAGLDRRRGPAAMTKEDARTLLRNCAQLADSTDRYLMATQLNKTKGTIDRWFKTAEWSDARFEVIFRQDQRRRQKTANR